MKNARFRASTVKFHGRRFSRLFFALHLACLGAFAAPALAAEAVYDIPAGPLGEALNRFAVQAGVSIAVDADKLRSLRSDGLHGSYDVEAGFRQLLRNSGYTIGRTAAGYVLIALPKTAPAAPAKEGERREAMLADLLVVGQFESAGTSVIDRQIIDAMPAGNGDITSLLKILPGVQFDNNQLHTGKQGELAPADISINGAKFYQNLYQLDGMSFNNDIDPASGDKSSSITEVTSAAQGFAIDTSLLCKITVRDSNVPVEYGGFTGGVVSADTCAPTRDFGGQISVGTTRSSWMEYKIAPEQQSNYENSSSPDYASKFDKWTYRVALQGKLSDTFSLIGSFIRKTSTIPLTGTSAYQNGLSGGSAEQTRQTDNWFVKAFWKPTADHDVDFSVSYAPTKDDRFIASIKDSHYTYQAGGLGLNGGWTTRFAKATLTQRLTATQMDSSRDGDLSTYKTWRYSADDKNWGTTTLSMEGGYGDVEQRQTAYNYLAKLDLEPVSFLWLDHKPQVGVEFSQKESYYNRKTQYESYYTPTVWAGSCVRGDGTTDPYCSTADNALGTGQYLRDRVVYLAGKFTVKDETRTLFLQDEIKKGDFTARLGLRYEDSKLAPEATLSPRSAFFYDVFGDGATRLEAGANRYYGRNFMSYYMQANRLSLQSTTTTSSASFRRTGLTDWGTLVMSATADGYHFDQLKVPYDDEMMVAARQRWAGLIWGLKYVDRKSRDQVVQRLRGAGDRWFENSGYGTAQTLSATVETFKPWRVFGTATSMMFAVEQMKVETSHADYYNNDLDYNDAPMIVYDGKLIGAGEKPADNYNRPWTWRALFMTEIPAWNLSVGNFIRWRAGYQKMVQNGTKIIDGSSYTNYDRMSFKPAITWDMRFNWEVPTSRPEKPYIALSIDNVLNATNAIENSGSYLIYEKGRQFWLEMGVRF